MGARICLAAATATALMPAIALPAFSQANGEMLGTWNYACVAGSCRGMLGVREGENSLFGLVIQRSGGDDIVLLVRVPLGAVLPPGVRIYTSNEEYFDLQYQTCTSDGCDAVVKLDSQIERQIASTNTARVAFFLQDGTSGGTKGYSYGVPIEGVSEVLERLRREPN